MKLLFDQNISFRVIGKIAQNYPEARQVRALGLENFTDIEIWNFAKKNNYTIVTFDADFYEIATLKGHPPKIIWLRFGNTSTDNIASLFNHKFEIIKEFILHPENSGFACLELD